MWNQLIHTYDDASAMLPDIERMERRRGLETRWPKDTQYLRIHIFTFRNH